MGWGRGTGQRWLLESRVAVCEDASPPSSVILAPGLLGTACPSALLLLTAKSLAQNCSLRSLLALTQVGKCHLSGKTLFVPEYSRPVR